MAVLAAAAAARSADCASRTLHGPGSLRARATAPRIAAIKPTTDRYSIEHDGGQRRMSITFNVSGSAAGVVRQAQGSRPQRQAAEPVCIFEFTAQPRRAADRNELALFSGLARRSSS